MPQTRDLVQIIDKETGDVNNLRDKKLADATVQQQSGSASTDSVMMKTTGGEYVEIARDSFVGAIKSVMDGLIKGNSYTTLGANDPIAAFNSNALGGITPANLASVLGVKTFSPVYWARNNGGEIFLYRVDANIPQSADVGVGFFEGGKLIVIAFDETILKFNSQSSANYSYQGDTAYQISNGKTCRELTEAHAATVNEGANCAAGYCLAYQASGDVQRAWALPGIREWLAIYNHIEDINRALQYKGAQTISDNVYWTANVAVERGIFYSQQKGKYFNWNSWNGPREYSVRPVLVI